MAVGLVGLILLLQLTTPATVHPIGILIVFICIYLLVLGALTFFIFWGSRIYARLLSSMTAKQYQTAKLVTVYPVCFGSKLGACHATSDAHSR